MGAGVESIAGFEQALLPSRTAALVRELDLGVPPASGHSEYRLARQSRLLARMGVGCVAAYAPKPLEALGFGLVRTLADGSGLYRHPHTLPTTRVRSRGVRSPRGGDDRPARRAVAARGRSTTRGRAALRSAAASRARPGRTRRRGSGSPAASTRNGSARRSRRTRAGGSSSRRAPAPPLAPSRTSRPSRAGSSPSPPSRRAPPAPRTGTRAGSASRPS